MKNEEETPPTLDEMLEIAKEREKENERIYQEQLEKRKKTENK